MNAPVLTVRFVVAVFLTVRFGDVPIVRFEVAVLSLLRLTVLFVNPALTVRLVLCV